MNNGLKSVIAGSLLLVSAVSANAGTIYFTTCLSTCDSLGVLSGAVIPSVATLEFNDNGLGGVDFKLTNTIENMFPTDLTAYLSALSFNTDVEPGAIIPTSDSIKSFAYSLDKNNSGIDFDIEFDFEKANNDDDRLTNDKFATWTFANFTAVQVELPAMVHIQATAFTNGRGSVKVTGGGTIVENPREVPEPGLLVLLGTALLGLGLSRKRKAKA